MPTPLQFSPDGLRFFESFSLAPHHAVLVALVLIATVTDVRERRIPNWLVATGMVLGLLFHAFAPQGKGALFALSGLAVGMLVMFPFFAMRMLGAGDVKLFGAIGAFLGAGGALGTILASAAAGGALALAMTARRRMLPQLLANLRHMLIQRHIRQMVGGAATLPEAPSVGKMPYAVAILAGTVIQLFFLRY